MRRRKLDDRSPLRTTGGGEGQDVRHRDASSADYDGFTASRRCRHRPGRELPWNGIAHVSKPAADARAEAPESPAAGCPSSRREREARRSIPARRDAQERRKPRATRVRRHGQAHGLIPVSYTHLDVYKRQPGIRAPCGFQPRQHQHGERARPHRRSPCLLYTSRCV